MRPFEILLAVLAAASTAALLINNRRWQLIIATAALISLLLQFAVEKYRWQLLPLYLLVLLLSGYLLSGWKLNSNGETTLSVIAGGWLLLGIALPILLPVPSLPKPDGSYAIGTFSLEMVDSSRRELYSSNADDPRRIMVQVWYPAQPAANSEPAPWIDHVAIMGPAISAWIDLPPFFLNHVALARTHAYLNAPISGGENTYPVILFSHGWGGFRSQTTYLMEELASSGYIVIAAQHTYGAIATVFPDGTSAKINPAALPSDLPPEEIRPIGNRLVNQWAGDLAFILDTLQQIPSGSPLAQLSGHLNLDEVGVMGHSTGGGAATEFCGVDPRCRAGLTLDAYMAPVSPDLLDQGLDQPFLFVFSELWPKELNNQLFSQLYQHQKGAAAAVTILGAGHYDFTDVPMLTPIAAQIGLKGPINGLRAVKVIREISLDFFNQTLRGMPGEALSFPKPEYPEVILK